VHHQDDVIINQDLGVLVSNQNPIRQHPVHFEFQKWRRMKHPSGHYIVCSACINKFNTASIVTMIHFLVLSL